jgi:hypothetical protein
LLLALSDQSIEAGVRQLWDALPTVKRRLLPARLSQAGHRKQKAQIAIP